VAICPETFQNFPMWRGEEAGANPNFFIANFRHFFNGTLQITNKIMLLENRKLKNGKLTVLSP
jgi:hypothetical protein